MTTFQINDPSLESQWRAIILFGKNSATYKFAFARALLDVADQQKTFVTLTDLAEPFSRHLVEHLKGNDKQGNSPSSAFLTSCRDYAHHRIDQDELLSHTLKLGFVNVVDAFQVVNNAPIPQRFYDKKYTPGSKGLVITDHLFRLKESVQYQNFAQEVEGRWKLVETAWNLRINPNLLEVEYDQTRGMFFVSKRLDRRVDITSVRDSLNGYQKGKCFYSFRDISVIRGSANLCEVDHFLPHKNSKSHRPANLNGVWNLVLADRAVNGEKSARVPAIQYLERLFQRNEFFIESKHPLAETIINQTGRTPAARQLFLQTQYSIALTGSIHQWKPDVELASLSG